MRKVLTDRSAVSVLFVVLLGVAVYQAFAFNNAARLMPLIIGIPTLALSLAVLGMEVASQRAGTPERRALAKSLQWKLIRLDLLKRRSLSLHSVRHYSGKIIDKLRGG